MSEIKTNTLTPGMVLTNDIEDRNGYLLLPAGTQLGEGHILLLKKLGLGAVEAVPEAEAKGITIVDPYEEYIRNFFVYCDPDNEAMLEIYRIAVARTKLAVERGWIMPTEDERLARNLEFMKDLYRSGEGTAKDIVDHETELATFPDIYFRIKEVLDAPSSSANDIARVVSTDVGLSAKLLKLVNSPFYGFADTIDSIAHAVSLVGIKEISTLALGISTINFFKDIPPELMDMKTFWRHSLSCGILSRLIAMRAKKKDPSIEPDRLFTAGLLHDVGRLIIFKKQPYASVQALLYARENMLPLVDAEAEVLGFDHTEVANLLLSEWNFPAAITAAIVHHHDPQAAQNPKEAGIIQIADNLTNAVEISGGGMYVLPGIQDNAWEGLGLNTRELVGIVDQFDEHIEDVLGAFL
ncbi:HDOD domain-containing protein [Desulfovibrio ferrophilus]|uniref:Metal dependent phosphohydrolase n=1 Tax=Desulfovibrio ferrophilus TaxID=241368 RepID=A0A2Z6B186_9BACT|nr:HDOD domain-containing protein [Desulfovibrio ferrophilus]BBD09208.1 metal dependent phosphohydrolase [Desulfovibrio ferrophilus]